MKQIKLLSHTREDVIKLLGNPVDNRKEGYLWYYDFPEGRMEVLYQTKQCVSPPDNEGKRIGWKVPEWTVVEVGFSLNERTKPKKLNLGFEGFVAKPIYDVPDAFEYTNEESGIEYGINEGNLEDITFVPVKKYSYLHC